jgi:hypothetical protein
LTHDYLVPALRQWLTRKQRETRQGRMELLLAERVSLWAVKQDSRQLPGWWEWLNILLWTPSRNRTDVQSRMLRAATRWRLLQAFFLVLFATLFGWILVEVYQGPVKADYLVRALASADVQEVDQIIKDMDGCRRWADPKLRALAASSSRKEQLHASLALLPVDPGQVAVLEKRLLDVKQDVGPDEALAIAGGLRKTDQRVEVASRLRLALLNSQQPLPPDCRFRAACALAFLQPEDPWADWKNWSVEVADKLVKKDLTSAQKWSRLPMEGFNATLAKSLQDVFLDPDRPESERANAAALTRYSVLTYSILSADKLMNLVLEIEGEPYSVLNEWFVTIGQDAATLVHRELDKVHPAKAGSPVAQSPLLPQPSLCPCGHQSGRAPGALRSRTRRVRAASSLAKPG